MILKTFEKKLLDILLCVMLYYVLYYGLLCTNKRSFYSQSMLMTSTLFIINLLL